MNIRGTDFAPLSRRVFADCAIFPERDGVRSTRRSSFTSQERVSAPMRRLCRCTLLRLICDTAALFRLRLCRAVMYPVSDLARSATFYREILGLTQEVCSEEWHRAEFHCGEVTIALHEGVEFPQEIAGGRIALALDGVQAADAELKRCGMPLFSESADQCE